MKASGINDVPEELLSEIFSECLPVDCLKIGLSPTEAPIVLTHVCQKWKRTVFESPGLWKWIQVQLSDKKFKHAILGSMCQLIERVKARELNLQIFHHRVSSNAQQAIASPNAMAMLALPLASSLTRLTLIRVPIEHIEAVSPAFFPRLERLCLEMDGNHEWQKWGKPLVSFQHSPSLHYLAISPWSLDRNMNLNIILPHLSQLTHLFLGLGFCENGATAFFTHILPQCTQLRFLHIPLREDDLGIPEVSSPPSHRLEKMEALVLYYYHGLAGYPPFFDRFTFPNLTSLRVKAEELDFSTGEWTPQSAQRFLAKVSTFQKLDQLSIRSDMGMTLFSLIRWFKAAKNITTLELSVPMDYEGYEELFGELSVLYPENSHLVKLRSLILEFQPDFRLHDPGLNDPLNATLFTEFVQHRLNSSPPENGLKKVVLIAKQETMDELDVLVQASEVCGRLGTGFLVERIIIKDEEEGEDTYSKKERRNLWVEREPTLQNWKEVTATLPVH
ncbi:hypothetical protein MD484_g6550, partial [Candolleomyces efflorescens]